MRRPRFVLIALLIITSAFVVAVAKEDGNELYRINPTQDSSAPFGVYVPDDLDGAFKELSRMLHPKLVEKIKSGTENDLGQYHHGLGRWIRNNWALWEGDRLSKWFNEKGIHHPDDMSSIILHSFWRHIHSQPIELDKQVAFYEEYWKKARVDGEREKERATRSQEVIRSMMMGLALDKTQISRVNMPDRSDGGLRARYLAGFRDGVLITIRQGFNEDFTTPGYFLDLRAKTIHPIKIPEIEELQSAIVTGGVAYFSGTTKGIPILVAVDRGSRLVVPLPVERSSPQLGTDGANLLAVYTNSIYAWGGNEWSVIYRGEIQLPRSGPPPKKSGNMVVFRDEGVNENEKRLWWLELTHRPKLVSLDQDIGVVGPSGPRWENSFSYCFTPTGDLWVTLGEGYAKKSLVKRSAIGKYGVALAHNSVLFDGTLLGKKGSDDEMSVSAVSMRKDGTVLAAGDQGLYTIQGRVIRQLLAFENTKQKIPINDGKNVYHWHWDPSDIIELDDENYIVSGAFGGIYLVNRDSTKSYIMTPLDEALGKPVTF